MIDVLSRIPVDALRVFETAARLLSFTRAAEALGMSQAAVSWRIRDLEQRLDRALFVRGVRQVSLTPEGERLATASIEAMTLLRRAVADVVEADQGVLAITTLQTLATQWLATRLGSFQLDNPDLAVRVDTSPTLSMLGADGLDVALRFGSGQWAGLESRFLMPAVFTPVQPGHALPAGSEGPRRPEARPSGRRAARMGRLVRRRPGLARRCGPAAAPDRRQPGDGGGGGFRRSGRGSRLAHSLCARDRTGAAGAPL